MTDNMRIIKISTGKEQYMDLLLLADEQESMVQRYLEKGEMYVLDDEGTKAVSIVANQGQGILELKNLAVEPQAQRQGYGKAMISFLVDKYRGRYQILQVGTGDSPLTIPFYQNCGFQKSHRVKDFFLQYYDHPIIEAGVQLRDMIYLQRKL